MLSKAAKSVLRVDLATFLVPKLGHLIIDCARDIANEDHIDDLDPFFVDEVASEVIRELCNFLTQSEIDTEGGLSPLIHPRQLKGRYARAFWDIKPD